MEILQAKNDRTEHYRHGKLVSNYENKLQTYLRLPVESYYYYYYYYY